MATLAAHIALLHEADLEVKGGLQVVRGVLELVFLGTVSLLSVTRIAGLTTIIVPLVVAGIPIIDTFSAIVRRTRAHVSKV